MKNRKILLMDRPSFWGAEPQHSIRNLLTEIREIATDFDVEYIEEQALLDSEEKGKRTELTRRSVGNAEIVVAFDLGIEAFQEAKNLKWLHILGAGVDHALYAELADSDVLMTSSKGNGGIPMAETALAYMLFFQKNILQNLKAQQSKKWNPAVNRELNKQTVGIIGLGHSGADLAQKCKAFHMRTLGLRRSDKPCPGIDEMFSYDRLQEFLRESDFVVITVPNTKETKDMLGDSEFEAMKDTAYLIVTSRGGVANDHSLLKALNKGWIAGAALDAHTEEPLSQDNPFWEAPNTIITAHMASTGQWIEERTSEQLLDNIKRYVDGKTLLATINKKVGY
ncbi:MAG: hydroxyacid dehydrogenase [Chloroflexi bacterium]|nr:hydroxyacid dehydrogenase [Chloroflexota bacterium]|tara:strand:+ start:333 stop:1346 length:1014 start_codon:yes stop_codon:yes gene_type:complete